MKKLIASVICAAALISSPASYASGEWIGPLLGGLIIGNALSDHRHYQPVYPIYQPPVVYVQPPPMYVVPQRCAWYPVYDVYGRYVTQEYRCF